MQIIKKTIFLASVSFIGLTIFSLTIGQILPIEFADYKMMHRFYGIIMEGLPISILLTLFGTIKLKRAKLWNITVLSLTILTSAFSVLIMVNLMFSIGFGTWITTRTIYKHKTGNKTIKEQWFDLGALGYGGQRIVEIKPVLNFWILPTEIDTTTINENEWIFVNEQGSIKIP